MTRRRTDSTMVLEGEESLDELFRTMTSSIERKALRASSATIGREIIKQARSNLKALGMTRKRGEVRRRKSKAGGYNETTGLAKALWQRPSAKWPSAAELRTKGIIGTTVGFRWPGGAHAHLVEFGHRVVLPAGYTSRGSTARFVKPYPFWRPAEARIRPRVPEIHARRVAEVVTREAEKARRKKQ